MKELYIEIKELIVSALELEDVSPAEIENDETLFGEGLGLDSIDALELGVAIQKKYGVKIDSNKEDLTDHFANVKSLAQYIENLLAKKQQA